MGIDKENSLSQNIYAPCIFRNFQLIKQDSLPLHGFLLNNLAMVLHNSLSNLFILN